MTKYKSGIVVGRFQPFHNGHLRYVLKALEKCEFLYIGITTPGETPTEFEPKDPSRLGKQNNPFSYTEREQMILLALKDRQVDQDRFQLLPFDPHNIDTWFAAVPSDAVYFLILTGHSDQQKVKEMEARGLTVVVLDEISDRDFVGDSIRKQMLQREQWHDSVAPSVAKYLEQIDAVKRMKRLAKEG